MNHTNFYRCSVTYNHYHYFYKEDYLKHKRQSDLCERCGENIQEAQHKGLCKACKPTSALI